MEESVLREGEMHSGSIKLSSVVYLMIKRGALSQRCTSN